jgi:hypothetical protein
MFGIVHELQGLAGPFPRVERLLAGIGSRTRVAMELVVPQFSFPRSSFGSSFEAADVTGPHERTP